MCVKLFTLACKQPPSPRDGMRKTRWAIVRNTSPELRTTTIKTWLDWFPEDVYGKMRWSPPFTHRIIQGDLDMEVIFLALDREDDAKKLLSLELTGVFFNEGRELQLSLVTQALSRTGRYPSMRDGGPRWFGGFADTNAPDFMHWWPIMSGETPAPESMTEDDRLSMVKPDNWNFYVQPPAAFRKQDERGRIVGYQLNDAAENVQNLTKGYYPSNLTGRTASWIKVYILNELGQVIVGDPVWKTSFSRDMHVVNGPIEIDPLLPIRVGVDFGIPAAIIGQKYTNGRWNIIQELVIGKSMGARRFARLLKPMLANLQKEMHQGFMLTGDPKGQDSAQSDESTAYQMFSAEKLTVMPAPTNDIAIRLECVEQAFGTLIEGKPAVQISNQGCPQLVTACESGYVYDKYGKPVKNVHSHPADSLQYLMLGGGGMMNVLPSLPEMKREENHNRHRPSPFSRLRGRRNRPTSRLR